MKSVIKDLEDLLDEQRNTTKSKDKSGFFDLPEKEICNHHEHNPPNHICIPQGKGYRHVCPSCGKVQIIVPPQITL